MRYVLCNFYITNNSILDNKFTLSLLKTCGYASKIKNKVTGKIVFSYVLIPEAEGSEYLTEEDKQLVIDFASTKMKLKSKIDGDMFKQLYSLYVWFKDVATENFTMDIINTIDDTSMDIFWSDGSSHKDGGWKASYGAIKLTGESDGENTLYDDVSGKRQSYVVYSDAIDGTNNVGELSGLNAAVTHYGEKQIQVIVSDSMLTLNSFREWVYNWKNNNWKGSNNKTIKNLELIQSIQKNIEDARANGKIFIFKWTKGHVDTEINEACDNIAKDKLGIKK